MDRSERLSGKKVLIVGLTLFSMFFGAGNLIFPPFLAVQAGTSIIPAAAGFLISAVGLPVLGVIAVARSGGLEKLAGRVHPALHSFLPFSFTCRSGRFSRFPGQQALPSK